LSSRESLGVVLMKDSESTVPSANVNGLYCIP